MARYAPAPRNVGDGKASFRHEHHKMMLERGGLMPPNPSYTNPTLSTGESTSKPLSFRKEYRMLQMGSQGLNPPKHEPGFEHHHH